jgi:hypothetical protein
MITIQNKLKVNTNYTYKPINVMGSVVLLVDFNSDERGSRRGQCLWHLWWKGWTGTAFFLSQLAFRCQHLFHCY